MLVRTLVWYFRCKILHTLHSHIHSVSEGCQKKTRINDSKRPNCTILGRKIKSNEKFEQIGGVRSMILGQAQYTILSSSSFFLKCFHFLINRWTTFFFCRHGWQRNIHALRTVHAISMACCYPLIILNCFTNKHTYTHAHAHAQSIHDQKRMGPIFVRCCEFQAARQSITFFCDANVMRCEERKVTTKVERERERAREQ